MTKDARAVVVGAGIAGAACARALSAAGVGVTLRERGRAPGGRMASPSVHARRVDLGAGYFTVADDAFREVVDGWCSRGLARPWTDTFQVVTPAGVDTSTGPVRYATPGGLRSLVRDLLEGCHVDLGAGVESLDAIDDDADAVVLAMPDPQAARLVGDTVERAGVEAIGYEPVIAVAAAWPERSWPVDDAAFVNDDPDLSFVADDGARRGDGAAVLVAHTTAERARRHLERPDDAIAPVLTALRRLLGVQADPVWTHAHRWGLAKPVGTHGDAPYALLEHTGRPLGLCTDSWCPSGSPRVEAAWLSGHRLGTALATRLTA